MSETERNDDTQQEAQEQQEERPEGEIRYGYTPDGRFIVDGVETDRITSPSIAVNNPPQLPEDVVAQLEEAKALREKYQELEPLAHLKDREDFREWLSERVQFGEIADPNPPPRVSPADIMGRKDRLADPNAEEIILAMNEYAATLPSRDAELLDSNHVIFNKVFDEFRQSRGNRPPLRAGGPVGVPIDLEKILRSKEVKAAFVEPPGGVRQEPDPREVVAKQYQRIRAELRENLHPNRRTELETEMARLIIGNSPEDKKKGGQKESW